MLRRTVGPRGTDSHRTYVRGTRIIAGLSVLVLSGLIVWDLVNDGIWSRHALFTSLGASLIIVAMTAAGLNEPLQRRRRERWFLRGAAAAGVRTNFGPAVHGV
jgi:hypothetical protein